VQDKQARLLAEENPGHFSLVRALHLADFITELNGKPNPTPTSAHHTRHGSGPLDVSVARSTTPYKELSTNCLQASAA